MPIDLDPTALKVTFTVDGEEFCVDAWPDLSALRTIRDIARHPRPRRGCEMGSVWIVRVEGRRRRGPAVPDDVGVARRRGDRDAGTAPIDVRRLELRVSPIPTPGPGR